MKKVTITGQYDDSEPCNYDDILEVLTEQGFVGIEIHEETEED